MTAPTLNNLVALLTEHIKFSLGAHKTTFSCYEVYVTISVHSETTPTIM